ERMTLANADVEVVHRGVGPTTITDHVVYAGGEGRIPRHRVVRRGADPDVGLLDAAAAGEVTEADRRTPDPQAILPAAMHPNIDLNIGHCACPDRRLPRRGGAVDGEVLERDTPRRGAGRVAQFQPIIVR